MKKENKKKKKVVIGIGLTVLTILGGIIAYKKCPKFKDFVDSGVFKIKETFKIEKEPTPSFTTKPYVRKYELYKKNSKI